MAMPILSVPKYPDVPRVAGVPAVLRQAGVVTDAIGVVSNVSNTIERLTNGPVTQTWGVFDANGNDVLNPDTFIDIQFQNGSRLLDYPIEQGAFASYNKVANPYQASLIMAKGGSVTDQAAFLAALDAIAGDLNLYTIVTPVVTYSNVNLEAYDTHKERTNGANLVIVSLHFRQIRISAVVNGQKPVQNVAAVPLQSQGQVSANPISTLQQNAIAAAGRVLQSVKAGLSGLTP